MATPTQANITSLEALDSFRSSLIVFLTKARRSLDEAGEEVRRTRQWVQHDQRTHWEGEFRRRTKQLEQAQQELMSARMAGGNESAKMARTKAQRDLGEVEQKLRKLKAWGQNFDTAADPVVKRMESLRHSLNELPNAIAYLVNVQKTLEAYAQSGSPTAMPASAPSSSTESTEPGASPESTS